MPQVEDLMNQPPIVCEANDSVMLAAALMLEHNCGVIPVVDAFNHLVGIITDRDVCMAAYTEDMRLRHIAISDVMTRDVLHCSPTDTIRMAQELMRLGKVRRLPVLDDSSHVIGVLSSTDMPLDYERVSERASQ